MQQGPVVSAGIWQGFRLRVHQIQKRALRAFVLTMWLPHRAATISMTLHYEGAMPPRPWVLLFVTPLQPQPQYLRVGGQD